jgi:hypothetical protein
MMLVTNEENAAQRLIHYTSPLVAPPSRCIDGIAQSGLQSPMDVSILNRHGSLPKSRMSGHNSLAQAAHCAVQGAEPGK